MINKLSIFLRKNGFLLFLFICVCVVAVGTIFIATKDLRTADISKPEELVILEDKILEETADIGDKEVSLDTSSEETVEETLEEKLEEVVNEELDATSEDIAQNDVEDLEFIEDDEEEDDEDQDLVVDGTVAGILPVEGDLATKYTLDSLIYSKTLEEWRGHLGIDIKSPEGTKVRSPLDGTIKDVYDDDLWGIVIVIEHGQGLETKFANLGTKEMVKAGIKVNKGDYISTIGKTASIEMMMEPHLHYEATKNGKIIDPRSISK